MSRGHYNSHRRKLRRERIRREKHAQSAGPPPSPGSQLPPVGQLFAAERSMREIQALMDGQKFESIDEVNARMADLTKSGRIGEMAAAWTRDDPKWRAQELAYDALETGSLEEALRLAHEALTLDPECTDALRLTVSVAAPSLNNKLQLMRDVVGRAERNLGEEFFEETMGHFWGTISTRPYMRAKQHLAELLVETGRLDEAIAVFERMLELNTNDNQGARDPLVGLYVALNRPADADALMSRFPGEERILGKVAWARVQERWLAGKLDEAGDALQQARQVNPFVERYLMRTARPPMETPDYFRPGSDEEAQVAARDLELAWERHPGFREWVRGRR